METEVITKRARLQFASILEAADQKNLCITECFNIKSGQAEYVLCTHSTDGYLPLAKLFKQNPNVEITPPSVAKYKLI